MKVKRSKAKAVKIWFLLFLLLALASINASPPKDMVVSWFLYDVDKDSKDELLAITSQGGPKALATGETYGDHLKIYSDYEIINHKPVPKAKPDYAFDLSEIKPLKIQAGDINGDGVAELAVCVYKTAKFHPVLAKRPFFYDLKEGRLVPVWLGSRLARPFVDYILSDVDQDGIDEIVSIELLENGDKVVGAYDWKGFGFEVKALSRELNGEVAFLGGAKDRGHDIGIEMAGRICRLGLKGRELQLSDDEIVDRQR